MMDYNTSEPNVHYWTFKLLLDNVGPGDKVVETKSPVNTCAAQAFLTSTGKKLLIFNKRNRDREMILPPDASGGNLQFVAPSTGDRRPDSVVL
jgi:hypothetical protein